MYYNNKSWIWAPLFAVLIIFIFTDKSYSISIQKEEEMGKEFMKVVFQHYELIDDPAISDYINKVGRNILSFFPEHNFSYKFYLLKDSEFNAFAAPAGHVFITSGIFEAMESEEELAGILSHEIAHVECRHISQKIARSTKINMLTLAGVAAGIFAGIAGGSETAMQALSLGSVAAGESISLAYSREDEMQADQIGLKYLAGAGYSASGLLTMLKKIRSKEWYGTNEYPTYLRTHPASEERITYISAWIDKNKTETKEEQSKSGDFFRAHNKFIAINGEEKTALKTFKSALEKDPEDPMAHYGLGMVYDRLGDRKAALSHLQEALRKSALDPYILSDLGRIYFLNGEFSKAQGVLNDAVWGSPDNYEAIFYLGRTELELGEYGKATTALESLIQKKPDYPQGHYFLSKAYERTGQKGDAHYHLGIFYNDKGDLRTALFHLKKAQEYLDDPFKLAKIKEMLDEIEGPRRGRRGIRKGFKDSRVQGFKGFYLNHSFRLNPRLLDPLNPQLTHFTRILESSNP